MGRLLVLSVVIFITSCCYSYCGDLKKVWLVNGENFQTNTLVYSADGEKIFAHCTIQDSLGKRYVIQQWNVQTKKLEKELSCGSLFNNMIITKDNSTIIGSNYFSIKSFNLNTQITTDITFEHSNYGYLIFGYSFSQDESQMYIYDHNCQKIIIINPSTLSPVDYITTDSTEDFISSPDRQLHVTVNSDSTVSFWDFEKKKVSKTIKIKQSGVTSACFSFDNKYLALTYKTNDSVQNIDIYSVETGNLYKSYNDGITKQYIQTDISFLHNNNLLLIINHYTGDICVRDIETNNLQKLPSYLYGNLLILSPVNNSLAGIYNAEYFQQFNEDYTLSFSNCPNFRKNFNYISNFKISKDEKNVYIAGRLRKEGFIQKRDLSSGELIKNYKVYSNYLSDFSISKDETKIAYTDGSKNIYLLKIENDSLIIEKTYTFSNYLNNIKLTNDKTKIYVTSDSTGIYCINLINDSIKLIYSKNLIYNSLFLNSDETKILYCSRAGFWGMLQYNSDTDEYSEIVKKYIYQQTYHAGITQIVMSFDEKLIYLTTGNYDSYLYNAEDFSLLNTYKANTGGKCNNISTGSISSDNALIINFDCYPTCRLYNIKSGNNQEFWYDDSIGQKYKLSAFVNSVKFCNNDKYFIISCEDGSIGLFDISDITDVDDLAFHNENINVYPNPAEQSVTIDLCLNKSENVEIEIIALNGSLIKSIFNGYMPEGSQKIEWNCGEIANGIYFCKVSSNSFSGVKKIVVSR